MTSDANFSRAVPVTFDSPEKLPSSTEEARAWQDANRSFWESSPMRYDWSSEIPVDEGSKAFFEEIDRRFFGNVRPYMPWKNIPFDNIVPFEGLKDKDVLEIGVGMGSHAGLLAAHSKSYNGIDLTSYAVKMTSKRMTYSSPTATVVQMDAENMSFPSASFDFVWSWGVIHHSSNTGRILQEIHRVLRPGGKAVIMVYNRGWWNYYFCGEIIQGVVRGGIFKHGSLARSVQANTDGALARHYTASSWRSLVSGNFDVNYVVLRGPVTDLLPLPRGWFKDMLIRLIPSSVARFFTSNFGMGSYLISGLQKK